MHRLLGVFPTVEGLAVQALLVIAAGFIYNHRSSAHAGGEQGVKNHVSPGGGG